MRGGDCRSGLRDAQIVRRLTFEILVRVVMRFY